MSESVSKVGIELLGQLKTYSNGLFQVMQCIYDMFEGLGKRPSGDPKERAGQIFRKIDINGDGDLTENEFIKGCSDDKVERQDVKVSNKILLRK